jgi:hypothetical protein
MTEISETAPHQAASQAQPPVPAQSNTDSMNSGRPLHRRVGLDGMPLPLNAAQIEVLRSSRIAEAALELGITEAEVRHERRMLGLRGIRTKPWRPEEIAKIGTMPDADLAAIIHRSRSAIQKRRLAAERKRRMALRSRPWTNEEIAMLGSMADADLADVIGRTLPQVVFMRRARRIPMFQAKDHEPAKLEHGDARHLPEYRSAA